jgi:hypothetical protein
MQRANRPKARGRADFGRQIQRAKQEATAAGLLDQILGRAIEDDETDPAVRAVLERLRDGERAEVTDAR